MTATHFDTTTNFSANSRQLLKWATYTLLVLFMAYWTWFLFNAATGRIALYV